MDYQIFPAKLSGIVQIPSSKSLSHRRIFMAMLSQRPMLLSGILCCDDTQATLTCFEALGGYYEWQGQHLYVDGRKLWTIPPKILPVRSSASTLRFLIPICLTHPGTYYFVMEKSLSRRSLEAYQTMLAGQAVFDKQGDTWKITGGLAPGKYEIDGSLSSQFISGLLMALPLLSESSSLTIKNQMVSKDYMHMTLDVLTASHIKIRQISSNHFEIPGHQTYCLNDVGGQADASSAAFFETARYLGQKVIIEDYRTEHQADAAIVHILKEIACHDVSVNVSDIPDLVPALSLAMALSPYHYTITHASRLRDKECDRLQAVAKTLAQMGAEISETEDGLVIHGVKRLHGAQLSSWHDHRIAMMIAIAASVADEPVILYDADCVTKSWPDFFKVYQNLGGRYHELSLRQ